jgi:hypothetical protein
MSDDASRAELVRLLARRTGTDGRHETAIPELKLYRYTHPTEPAYLAGAGRVRRGPGSQAGHGRQRTYVYDRSQYLAVSVDLPVVGNVLEATPEEPYLCLTLTVDSRELAALIVETGGKPPRRSRWARALREPSAGAFSTGSSDWCGSRLTAGRPGTGAVILRELHYRLLQSRAIRTVGTAGDWRRTTAPGVGSDRLDQGALRRAAPDRGPRQARQHEPSALHSHFKAVAATSPIQYQKRLRCRSSSAPAVRGGERGGGRLQGWIRERVAIQPRIRQALRSAPTSRRRVFPRHCRSRGVGHLIRGVSR